MFKAIIGFYFAHLKMICLQALYVCMNIYDIKRVSALSQRLDRCLPA